MNSAPPAQTFLRAGALVVVSLVAAAIFLVAIFDYGAVRRNQVGSGWRFATHDEVASILKQCGVSERQIVKAGVFFPFGWAWNMFPEDRGKSDCVDNSLREVGATAVIYDGMG